MFATHPESLNLARAIPLSAKPDRPIVPVRFGEQAGWSNGYIAALGKVPAKLRASVEERKPLDMATVTPTDCEPLEAIIAGHHDGLILSGHPDKHTKVSPALVLLQTNGGNLCAVDAQYWAFFQRAYPGCTLHSKLYWCPGQFDGCSAVVVRDAEGCTVGLIAPIDINTNLAKLAAEWQRGYASLS